MKRRAQIIPRMSSRAASKSTRTSSQKRLTASKTKAGSVTKNSVKRRPARTSQADPKKTSIAVIRPLKPSVVRIMGRGQYRVNASTLKRLNRVDDAMVEMMSKEKPDDVEFKRRLAELTEIVVRDGKPLSGQQIIKSDVILPSADLPIDNAKRLFTGEGVIPRF